MNIGENIKRIRKQKGMSQEELASMILDPKGRPVSRVTITRYENGREPNALVLRKIADALDVNVAELTGEDPERTSKEKQLIQLLIANTEKGEINWYAYQQLSDDKNNNEYQSYLEFINDIIERSSFKKSHVVFSEVYYCRFKEANYLLIETDSEEKRVLIIDAQLDNKLVFELYKELGEELSNLSRTISSKISAEYDDILDRILESFNK